MCLLTVIIATVLHSVIASLIIYPLLLFPSCFQVQHICTANRRVITKLQRSQSAAERKNRSFVCSPTTRISSKSQKLSSITSLSSCFNNYFRGFMAFTEALHKGALSSTLPHSFPTWKFDDFGTQTEQRVSLFASLVSRLTS